MGQGKALMLSGQNASDDLFKFVKKGQTGEECIRPDATYRVSFEVGFATGAPAGAVGPGGGPGEAVCEGGGCSSGGGSRG